MRPQSLLRGLVTKAAECLLAPRLPLCPAGRRKINCALQFRADELPEVRETITSVLPVTGPFALLLEVGLAGSSGTVLLERWEFQCSANTSRPMDCVQDYRQAAMALRAIAAVSLALPAPHFFRNQLQYKLTQAGGEVALWEKGASVQRFPGHLTAASDGEMLSVWVGYRDPLPSLAETQVGSMLDGSRSASPKHRPRLQSSGNLAALTAKVSVCAESGFLPLCVSLGDEDDDSSESCSGDEMELVFEVSEEEGQSAASAVFRHICKEVQDLRLFHSHSSFPLSVQLREVHLQFAELLRAREEIAKLH